MDEEKKPDIPEEKLLFGVADGILDTPVSIKIQERKKPRWGKPAVKNFEIHGATLGTMIKISRELIAINLDEFEREKILESSYKLVLDHGRRVAFIIAAAIVNEEADPPRSLVNFILNNLTSAELKRLFDIVILKLDTAAFLTSIIMAKGITTLRTKAAMMNP